MNLEFKQQSNGNYAAEVQVTGDFNIHIETKEKSTIAIYQRGSENGEYASVTTFNGKRVIDCDFGALVYPKYIKVVSGSEVLSASVNFNEGGGSGSGSSDGVSIEYYAINNVGEDDSTLYEILAGSNIYLLDYVNGSQHNITGPYGYAKEISSNDYFNKVYKMAVTNLPLVYVAYGSNVIIDKGSWLENIKAWFEQMDEILTDEYIDSKFTPITKDQFYNLEA